MRFFFRHRTTWRESIQHLASPFERQARSAHVRRLGLVILEHLVVRAHRRAVRQDAVRVRIREHAARHDRERLVQRQRGLEDEVRRLVGVHRDERGRRANGVRDGRSRIVVRRLRGFFFRPASSKASRKRLPLRTRRGRDARARGREKHRRFLTSSLLPPLRLSLNAFSSEDFHLHLHATRRLRERFPVATCEYAALSFCLNAGAWGPPA
mmetsp:Transcript_14043/g.59143  ORF Transcript_14043/g.59143 Transcript_14043/m.59143 type:complete len:210 (+) Transcript_14043:638-1267(+)